MSGWVEFGRMDLPTDAQVETLIDARKGTPQGLASLDAAGRVPEQELPERLGEAALSTTIGQIIARPRPGVSDLQVITNAIAEAVSAGVNRVVLTRHPNAVWKLDGPIVPPSGITIDATATIVEQTVVDEPAYLVLPGADDVVIHSGLTRMAGPRPSYSELPTGMKYGWTAVAACSGVMGFAHRTSVTGRFEGFRNAVRLASWSGVGNGELAGLKDDCSVDIDVADVDFGLVWYGQRRLRGVVRGSYRAMEGSPDASHLVYATTLNALTSVDCHVNLVATGSAGPMDGVAAILRTQKNFTSDYMIASGCPGVLNIESARGTHSIGRLVGSELTGVVIRSELGDLQAAALRTGTDLGDSSATSIGSLTIDLLDVTYAPGVPASYLRAVSIAAPDTAIRKMRAAHFLDSLASEAFSVVVAADRSAIGDVEIRNAGSGGISGIRYSNGEGHRLLVPPKMSGVVTGVRVEDTVRDSSFRVVPDQIIRARATDVAVRGAGGSGVTFPGLRVVAQAGAWSPIGRVSDPGNATLTAGNLYLAEWDVQREIMIDAVAVQIVTAQPATTIRMGLYRRSQDGIGSTLIRELGSIDASASGAATVVLADAVRIRPGEMLIGYVTQGASGVVVSGRSNLGSLFPAAEAAVALAGATPYVAGVSGNLPASIEAVSFSSSTVARIVYRIATPS